MDGTTAITDISSLISLVTEGLAFIWGLFGDFIDVITANPIILFMVLLAIVCGAVGLVVLIVRKFGLKGRRK